MKQVNFKIHHSEKDNEYGEGLSTILDITCHKSVKISILKGITNPM